MLASLANVRITSRKAMAKWTLDPDRMYDGLLIPPQPDFGPYRLVTRTATGLRVITYSKKNRYSYLITMEPDIGNCAWNISMWSCISEITDPDGISLALSVMEASQPADTTWSLTHSDNDFQMTAANNTSNLSTDPAVGTVIATIDRAARAFAATTHVQPLLTAIPCLTAQHIELSTDIQPAYSVWLAWEATNIVLSMRHNIFTMRVGDDYRSDLAVNIENSKFVSRADTRLSLTMEDIISRLKLPSGMPLFPDNQLFNSTVGDGTNNPTDMELIIIASILIVNSPFLSGRNHGKGIPVPEPYASLILTPNP